MILIKKNHDIHQITSGKKSQNSSNSLKKKIRKFMKYSRKKIVKFINQQWKKIGNLSNTCKKNSKIRQMVLGKKLRQSSNGLEKEIATFLKWYRERNQEIVSRNKSQNLSINQ